MEISQALQRYRDWLAFLDQTEADLEAKLEQQRGGGEGLVADQPLMTASPLPPPPPPRPARPPVPPPLTAPEETTPVAPATLAAPPTTAPEETTPAALPVDAGDDWVSELLPEMDAVL